MKIKLEVAYTNEETISQLDSALEEIEDIKVEKFEQNGLMVSIFYITFWKQVRLLF
jgi:hypothetical protein